MSIIIKNSEPCIKRENARPASASGQDLEEPMKGPPISVLLSVNESDNKNPKCQTV